MTSHPTARPAARPRHRLLAATIGAGLAVSLVTATAPAAGAPPARPLPTVSPAPQEMSRSGADVVVPGRVEVVTGPETDPAARELLLRALRAHGADRVDVVTEPGNAPLSVRLGSADRADVAAALGDLEAPDHAEGYALHADRDGTAPLGTVALGSSDSAGQYYAVQSLRQLFVPTEDDGWRIAGAQISDHPSMPLRGTIEGFYGEPWSHQERLDQLSFYGDVKANTYIYAPKDDPYHRERWREPYPADKLAELSELVDEAGAHHVRFTFALSPGNTVCYSSEEDYDALVTKLQEMYDVGVRAFSIPLDDIAYGQWNCEEDRAEFGAPSAGAAGEAQAQLLDRVQREFIETRDGAQPLQMVPTEYYNTVDSPYKEQLRTLDEDIIVMWTGEGVVPASVTVEQAEAASEVFGGPPFLWDNYPVNDFGNTSGRLLLAPYDKREAGLSAHLSGIVSNPMNQAAASKIAIFGFADFSWNDQAYDADRNWLEAMRYLSDDNTTATAALQVFGDLNHMAPTFGSTPWQAQSPELGSRIERFWSAWDTGDRAEAVGELRGYVDAIAAAPETIRDGDVDAAFVSDAAPWLDATDLWGESSQRMLDALEARIAGDVERSEALATESERLMEQAQAVVVDPPDNSWGRAPVKIADGVLDQFLVEAGLELQLWDLGDAANLALTGTATASSTEQDLDRLAPRFVNDDDDGTRWASGYSDDAWVQVELAEPASVKAVTVSWESACADAYQLQTSSDGTTWTTVADVDDSSCALDVVELDDAEPVTFVRMQGVQRRTSWGYSIYELGVYGASAD